MRSKNLFSAGIALIFVFCLAGCGLLSNDIQEAAHSVTGTDSPKVTEFTRDIPNESTEAPLETSSVSTETFLPATATPTKAPTTEPTNTPAPTKVPTTAPTNTPIPTKAPTAAPTNKPIPTKAPTAAPTNTPEPTITRSVTPEPTKASQSENKDPYKGNIQFTGHYYATPSGKRYHYSLECGGKNSKEITWEEAEKRGLTPCGTCVLK